jgi:hypothetical protein
MFCFYSKGTVVQHWVPWRLTVNGECYVDTLKTVFWNTVE